MASTYDNTLSTSRDRVRFLLGDVATPWEFDDNEIDWVLTEQDNEYLAAARLLSGLAARWAGKGRGIDSKRVSRLRVQYGGLGTAAVNAALNRRVVELRQLGMPTPKILKVL